MAKLTSKSAKKTAQATKKATNGSAMKNGKKAKIVDLDDDVTDQEDDEQMSDEEATTNKNGGEHEHAASSSSSSSLLADCEKYFGSRDLYSILNLNKAKANESEIKKAYYKLSLKYHPDKAEETRRDESTIKFQVLSKIYSILSDAEKKKLYDEQGVVDDESGELEAKDWTEYWRTLFKKVTKADFDKFFVDYRNSDEERADLLRLYEKHEGDMGEILDEMFSQDRVADEPRFRQIIEEAIDAGKAKSHKKFTGESKQKAARRKAAYEREAIEAQEEMVKQGIDESEESLKNAILARRQMKNDDFLAKLEKKYAGKSSAGKKKGASKRGDQEPSEEEDNDEEAYEVKPKKARGVPKASAVAAKKPAAKAGAAKKVKRL